MTTFVKASCHCGRNTFQVCFKTSSLPKPERMCHCNICRHTTGNMAVVDPVIDGEPYSADSTEDHLKIADLSNLKAYQSSTTHTRYFCATCNAHMLMHIRLTDGEFWTVYWGVLDKIDGILKIISHIFVADTLDGGVANHLVGPPHAPFPRYNIWSATEGAFTPGTPEAQSPETLPIHCHCRKASFYLTRALKASENPAEYWLVPGKEPTDPIRFITAHCLCNSCRQTSGGHIQTWTIVPQANVFDAATNQPVNLEDPTKRPQGLSQYQSSEGKYRESCGTCGATVFWWRKMKDGETPHMDVATALVDEAAAGGARAESWLSWYPRVIHSEFAASKEVGDLLVEGVQAALGKTQ